MSHAGGVSGHRHGTQNGTAFASSTLQGPLRIITSTVFFRVLEYKKRLSSLWNVVVRMCSLFVCIVLCCKVGVANPKSYYDCGFATPTSFASLYYGHEMRAFSLSQAPHIYFLPFFFLFWVSLLDCAGVYYAVA